MHTGKGVLVLRDGRTLPLTYQFTRAGGDMRDGYLFCDASKLDHDALSRRLQVSCDDGTNIVVVVLHSSNQYVAVTGRVSPAELPG
jgi:hypothetical protein